MGVAIWFIHVWVSFCRYIISIEEMKSVNKHMKNLVNKPSQWLRWNIYCQHCTSLGKLISVAVNVKRINVTSKFRVRTEEWRQAHFFLYSFYNSGKMEWKNHYCSISHFKGCWLHVLFIICVFVEFDEVLETWGGNAALFWQNICLIVNLHALLPSPKQMLTFTERLCWLHIVFNVITVTP